MTTATVSAADVNKLRQMTGAGMMDCKKALAEAGGDFEKAIDELRKKGQKVAANRAGREAREGYIVARADAGKSKGFLVAISCETDFVAKNADFVQFAEKALELAMQNGAKDAEALKKLPMDGATVGDGRPGPVTRRIHDEYWGRKEKGWLGTPVDYGSNQRVEWTARG